MSPVVRVVGLGPGNAQHLTEGAARLIAESPVVRFRTTRHPGVARFGAVQSYDDLYERAESYDALYGDIVDDLVVLAHQSEGGEVLYVVPGSPSVAEHTVELLHERSDVTLIVEPAVSVIDVACAALGRDAMSAGLRVLDALGASSPVRGPGPLLILQTYSPEVLALVADRLEGAREATILHHLGLKDEVITTIPVGELASFADADHLTSLWVDVVRDEGEAMSELWAIARRLRAECPWDQEQTHASLTRHLLEEAYEALDALEVLVRAEDDGGASEVDVAHVQEELGDLLFQVVVHAVIGQEDGQFSLTTIADAERDKLIYRHPHVFGDIAVTDADDVAARWEVLKQSEKGRGSITEGIAWQLPALTLYTKLLRKALALDLARESGEQARDRARQALGTLEFGARAAGDAESTSNARGAWGEAISAMVSAARYAGVDLEGVLRARATQLRDEIRSFEEAKRDE